MRDPVRRFVPAMPTILLAGILAIDFAEILNTLYLSILLIFPAVCLIVLVSCVVLTARTKDIRHPLTLSAMILLLGLILLPLLGSPISDFIKNNTSFNRVSAFIRPTYHEIDSFDFTITAHGNGSEDKFALDRGYTNISINENHYGGPSLYYRLRPDLEIRLKGEYELLSNISLRHAFDDNQLSQLSSTVHMASFKNILESLAVVDSQSNFTERFKDSVNAELDFVPHENTVYRTISAIIALMALFLSVTLCRRQQIVQQAGTGQPATRPLSDSEGSDKPQPEAEGRSR